MKKKPLGASKILIFAAIYSVSYTSPQYAKVQKKLRKLLLNATQNGTKIDKHWSPEDFKNDV